MSAHPDQALINAALTIARLVPQREAFWKANTEPGWKDPPAALEEPYDRAVHVLRETPPTTLAGCVAVLRLIAAEDWGFNSEEGWQIENVLGALVDLMMNEGLGVHHADVLALMDNVTAFIERDGG